MASSFAAYASQFLTNARGNGNTNTGTESGVEPLFYSFTTSSSSGEDEDGERGMGRGIGIGNGRTGTGIGGRGTGRGTGPTRGDEYDFDTDDPHLGSGSGSGSGVSGYGYGWLAHQGYEAGDPREEGNDNQDRESEDGSEDSGDLPSGLIASGLRLPPRTNAFDSLSESLLPSRTEPTSFNLPSPRRRRRKTQDAVWTWIWGVCICVCYLSALLSPSNTRIGSRVLLPTLPLLIPLIFLSAFASYLHIVFLRLWMRPVMFLSALGTPLLLLGSGVWGLLASYSTTSESILSLRLLSLLPLLICIYLLHSLYTLYIAFPRLIAQVNHTHALLSLSTFLLFAYPHPSFPSLLLPLLSPLLLFSFLLLSIPFAIVVSTAPTPWTLFAAAVWVWTWGVTRGVLRVTTAAVVGGWYFGVPWAPSLTSDVDLETDLDPDLDLNQSPLPSPSSPPSLLLLSALTRASHSSLGSIVVSALRETTLSSLSLVIRVLLLGVPALLFSLVSLFSAVVPSPVSPVFRVWISPVLRIIGFLRVPLSPLHRYITIHIPHTSPFPQIYIALTGVSYRTARTRLTELTSSSVGGVPSVRGLGGIGNLGGLRRFGGPLTSFPSLLSPLSPPLSLPLPFALITYYFFVSHSPTGTHTPTSLSLFPYTPFGTQPPTNTPPPLGAPPTLGAPHALEAWQASLLAALTTALVGIFCVGVLRDVGDAVWVCWVGDRGRERGSGRRFDTVRGDGRTSEARGEGRGAEARGAEEGEEARRERREMGMGRERQRTERGLELGTGIKERRDLVARVFEYGNTRGVPEVDSLLLPDTDTDTDGEGEVEGEVEVEEEGEGEEVIHINQIPREGIAYPHPSHPPSPIPPIPPTTQKRVPLIPLQVEKEEEDERDGIVGQEEDEDEEHEGEGEEEEEEDINPFHHSPNPSASSPYPAPSAPYPSSRPPVVSAPVRSSSSSLSSLSSSGEEGGFFGSGLFS